jgi:hypothetical protein
VIYLYAITDRPGTGLPEGPLDELASGEVAAVFADGDRQTEPTPEALWAHEEVVEALMARRTVLPMRFGTQVEGEAGLRSLLDARAMEFARVLDDVRGRVELSVRVAGGEATPTGWPPSGADYMRQRLDARREAAQVATAVHEPLARMAHRSTSDLSPRGGFLMTGSYLLQDDGLDRFTDQVHELQRTHPELVLTCTGPWPPYSFVEEAGS